MRMLFSLLICLLVSGCGANFFSAETVASYEIDGKKINYRSTKEQRNLKFKMVIVIEWIANESSRDR